MVTPSQLLRSFSNIDQIILVNNKAHQLNHQTLNQTQVSEKPLNYSPKPSFTKHKKKIPFFFYLPLFIKLSITGTRSLSVDCHKKNNDQRLRFIDLTSFKFVYDTNEFRLGQRNLLPAHLKPLQPKTGTMRQKAYPGNSLIKYCVMYIDVLVVLVVVVVVVECVCV